MMSWEDISLMSLSGETTKIYCDPSNFLYSEIADEKFWNGSLFTPILSEYSPLLSMKYMVAMII